MSPDGAVVAYHFFNTGLVSDRARASVAYTRADAGTEPGVFGGALGGYLTPSWTADGRVLVFYGAQRTSHVGIDTPGGDYVDWFGDPAVATLLTDGELTRAGDRLVAVGDQNDLRFYDTGSGAPALRCVMTGFNGDRERPDLVTGGRRARLGGSRRHPRRALGDLGACGSAARPLVVPGGQDPDWGPAALVSAPPRPRGRRFVSVRAANRRLRLAREPQGAADPHGPHALLRPVLTDRDADHAQVRPDREGERDGAH